VLIIWKGAAAATAAIRHWSAGQLVLVILGIAIGCGLLSAVVLLPYLYQLLIKEYWRLRWHHCLQGPLLLRRGRFPYKPEAKDLIQNYYKGHKTKEELGRPRDSPDDLENNTTGIDKEPGSKAQEGTGAHGPGSHS
jgi:solute carrier family 20 (sodium-dependent phosphate transporter)